MGDRKPKFNAKVKKAGGFNYPEAEDGKIRMHDYKHPVFCLKYQHNKYNISACDADDKAAFVDQLCLLSGMTWDEIQRSPKHGSGTEKLMISKIGIREKCPAFITNDVEYLLALRFAGKKPFLVHRDRFIAHVIFVDHDFTLYEH